MWIGARGRLVREVVESEPDSGGFAVADNGNRPVGWPYPGLLRRAKRRGIPVLTGSDPLSVPGDEARIGTAGVFAEAPGTESTVEFLRHVLLGGDATCFGRPQLPWTFLRNQLAARLRNSP